MGKPAAALVAIALVIAGCGSSRPSTAQRCHDQAVRWARSYVASFPSQVSQSQFDQLVTSDERVCMTPAPGGGQ